MKMAKIRRGDLGSRGFSVTIVSAEKSGGVGRQVEDVSSDNENDDPSSTEIGIEIHAESAEMYSDDIEAAVF